MESKISWEVIERPLFSNFQPVKGYKALFRSDNDQLLHIAKSTYTPTTNDRFLETVDKLSNITGFPIERFDEVQGGKKVMAFLKCTDPISVGGYAFKDYLMVGNSHDGSTGFFVGNSNIMIRCANRFTKQFRNLQVYHTKNHDIKIDELSNSFDDFNKQREKFYDRFSEYVDFEIVEEHKDKLVNLIAEVSIEEQKDHSLISTRKRNIISNIHESIQIETSALGNNIFGLFNGITHYTSHTKKVKEPVFCNAFGTVADINNKAFTFCESLVNH